MSLFSRDPILLTPGPLTTSLATKTAMLRDWGSWDAGVQRGHRRRAAQASRHHSRARYATCACRCRAAGRSRSRRRSTRSSRATAIVLVLINGAYGTRLAKLTKMMGRKLSDVRDGRGRADDAAGRRSAADRRSVDHARRAHPLRDVDRHPESAAGDRRRRRAPRQEPHRRCDELVRGDRDRRPHDAIRRADRGVGQMRRGSAGDGLRVRAQERARAVRGQLDVARARSPRPVDLHGKDDAVALHAADARRRRLQRGARPARRGGRPAGAARALRAQLRRRWSRAWRSSAFACS